MHDAIIRALSIFSVLLAAAGIVRLVWWIDPPGSESGSELEIGDKSINFHCTACGVSTRRARWSVRRTLWFTLRPLSKRLKWSCRWCQTSHVDAWLTFHAKPPAPVVTSPAVKPEPSRNPEERFAPKE